MVIEATTLAVIAVLSASALHAIWNALLAGGGNQIAKTRLIILMNVLSGSIFLSLARSNPIEIIAHSWGWLLACATGHTLYWVGLGHSFNSDELGRKEFSAIYGVIRGTAPVLIAVGALIIEGELPTLLMCVGILTVSAGAVLLKLSLMPTNARTAFGWAIVASLGTVLSTLFDGQGVKRAIDPLGFFGCSVMFGGMCALAVFTFKRIPWAGLPRIELARGAVAGLLSIGTYSITIWALTVHPFGKVATLRETGSIILGAFIGWWYFKEPFSAYRIFGCALVVLGAGLVIWLRR